MQIQKSILQKNCDIIEYDTVSYTEKVTKKTKNIITDENNECQYNE